MLTASPSLLPRLRFPPLQPHVPAFAPANSRIPFLRKACSDSSNLDSVKSVHARLFFMGSLWCRPLFPVRAGSENRECHCVVGVDVREGCAVVECGDSCMHPGRAFI